MISRKEYAGYLERYEKMSNKKKVEVLNEALLVMQGYNGMSTDDSIVMAMGGDYAMEEEPESPTHILKYDYKKR